MYFRALFSLLFITSLFAAPQLILKERLGRAKNGDYIVAESGKMLTLLAIRSIDTHSIILEEISAPFHNLKERPTSWNSWVKERAPGHTSWSMLEIDLDTGKILECYSFSRGAWIETSGKESLFATLLNLPLEPVPSSVRRKIGAPPREDEPDHRQVWQPPLTYQGKKLEKAPFDAYATLWPKDGSELANKTVALYFDQTLHFPLPFWIQVESTHASATFHVIDSGRALPAHYRAIPRRIPEFLGQPKKTETGLKLSLKSPKYYRAFDLFAIDITTREKQIFPISHSVLESEGELLTLQIENEHLKEVLEQNHKYTWLLVPKGHSESYTETVKPFIWTEN